MLKRRFLIFGSIVLLFIAAAVAYILFARFENYTIIETLRNENAGRTNYEKALGGIISYNPDGVSLMDYSANKKWNISYEMKTPQLEVSSNYVLIYDKQGSVLEVANTEGETVRINTSFPINIASISDNGNTAVVMQQQENSHIIMYDYKGTILAEGELHAGESGYPMGISLSSNGEVLAVSVLHLSEADIKTEVVFYDFSEEGSLKENNKSATFSFSDTVIPLIDHVEDSKVIAVGTNSAVIFSSGSDPKIINEIFYEKEIKSVVHNARYFGIITESESEDGEMINVLDLYTTNGKKRFSKEIDISYSKCKIMENNEILFTDGKETTILTSYGACRYKNETDSDIQNMLYDKRFRHYLLVHAGELSKIILK